MCERHILKWPQFWRSREVIGRRQWPQLTSKHQFDPKFEFSIPKNLGKDTPHVWEGVFWNDLHFGGQGRSSRSTPIFSKIEDWRSFEVTWPRNWRSFQNVLTYTCEVSFPRFFGAENSNLGSNWCFEVDWGHWRRPMTSLDLQNGGHFRIRPLTHVGCLFLGF